MALNRWKVTCKRAERSSRPRQFQTLRNANCLDGTVHTQSPEMRDMEESLLAGLLLRTGAALALLLPGSFTNLAPLGELPERLVDPPHNKDNT